MRDRVNGLSHRYFFFGDCHGLVEARTALSAGRRESGAKSVDYIAARTAAWCFLESRIDLERSPVERPAEFFLAMEQGQFGLTEGGARSLAIFEPLVQAIH